MNSPLTVNQQYTIPYNQQYTIPAKFTQKDKKCFPISGIPTARIIAQEAATGELQRWSDGLAKRRGAPVDLSSGFEMAFYHVLPFGNS